MATKWRHPEFGEFTFERYAWVTTVEAPAFRAFTYAPRYGNGLPPSGSVKLRVEADDDSDVPPAEVLSLVSNLLAGQDRLVDTVALALWDDFNGRGPDSRMWWRGNLEDVVEDVDPTLPPLDSAAAIFSWLRLSGIEGRRSGPRNERPAVELSFEAPFEEEHGVGVLTDGTAILGIGYSYDVRPFADR